MDESTGCRSIRTKDELSTGALQASRTSAQAGEQHEMNTASWSTRPRYSYGTVAEPTKIAAALAQPTHCQPRHSISPSTRSSWLLAIPSKNSQRRSGGNW
eukprot:scaffold17871_cov82-Phaeocystis_antarctica.AAC.6